MDATRDDTNSLSRRALIGGIGAAGAAVGLVGLAGSPVARAAGGGFPEAIDAPVTGLTYIGLDAFAFDVASTNASLERYYEHNVTGVQPTSFPNRVFAPLPIPVGSVVRQLNISYVGTPIPNIVRRALGSAGYTDLTPVQTTTIGGPGAKSETFDVDATITGGATYAVQVFCSAGDSVLGVEIGYIPPPQAFVPFSGSDARALDTRSGAPLTPGSDLVVDLSSKLLGVGRAAVVNLTATQTAGPGFIAAFSDGIDYPGNSSVNFTGAGQTVANAAVVAMSGGKIKLRCGPAATHVIVDVVGTLL